MIHVRVLFFISFSTLHSIQLCPKSDRQGHLGINLPSCGEQEIGHNFGGNHPDAYSPSKGYTCSTNEDRASDRILRSEAPACAPSPLLRFAWSLICKEKSIHHILLSCNRSVPEPQGVHLRLRYFVNQVQHGLLCLHVVSRGYKPCLPQDHSVLGSHLSLSLFSVHCLQRELPCDIGAVVYSYPLYLRIQMLRGIAGPWRLTWAWSRATTSSTLMMLFRPSNCSPAPPGLSVCGCMLTTTVWAAAPTSCNCTVQLYRLPSTTRPHRVCVLLISPYRELSSSC